MSYDTAVVIQAAGEPIHLDQAKLHLRVTGTDQDAGITGAIASAREDAESATSRQILHTRYSLALPAFPTESLRIGSIWAYCGIVLPHAPLVRVISITYYDTNGALQTVDAADYLVLARATPGYIVPTYGFSWPSTRARPDAVTITFDCGYASRAVASSGADSLTVTGPVTWAVDDPVRVSNSGGALPAPLAAGTTYYVKTAAAGVYTLAATVGGATIDLTDTGTGTTFIGEIPAGFISWMLLRIGALHENREAVAIADRGTLVTMGFADSLLDKLKVYLP